MGGNELFELPFAANGSLQYHSKHYHYKPKDPKNTHGNVSGSW